MRLDLQRIRNARLTRRLAVGAVGGSLALVVAIWAATTRGAFDGLVGGGVILGLVLSALALMPTRPLLLVHLIRPGEESALEKVGAETSLAQLDAAAIIEAECQAAMRSLPPRPVKPGPGVSASMAQAMSIPALMGSVSERSAASFRTEVNEFENELADWLARYERVRRAKAQGFAAIARVEEEGDAAADHVRLRLRFPAGFELPPDERYAGQPPSRPRFERFPTARFDPSLLSSLSNVGPLGSALPPSAAKVWRDRDALIVELGVGRINQSDYDDTDQFSLVAPAKPGNYEVGWELTADGLRRPSRGTLILGVKEPNAGSQCLATLDDARAECERLELD